MKSMGAHHVSHSTNLDNLAKEEKKYDAICNTLFLSDKD